MRKSGRQRASPAPDRGCQGTTARCLTHDLWDELGRQIDICLNAVTLDDVVARRVLGVAAVQFAGAARGKS